MLVTDLIPYGHDNAVTRAELVARTGFTDRAIRMDINRSDELILNLQDGKGYFKPLPEEGHLVAQWERLFKARIKDEYKRIVKARRWKGWLNAATDAPKEK